MAPPGSCLVGYLYYGTLRIAIRKIKEDQGFIGKNARFVSAIRSDPRYGFEDFEVSLEDYGIGNQITLGGEGGTIKNLFCPPHDLAYLLRHSTLTESVAVVNADGTFRIDYELTDTLDLGREEGRGGFYRFIGYTFGPTWHGKYGPFRASKPRQTGHITVTNDDKASYSCSPGRPC